MNSENGGGTGGSSDRIAPVIPLFGSTQPVTDDGVDPSGENASFERRDPSDMHPARGGRSAERAAPRLRALRPTGDQTETESSVDAFSHATERMTGAEENVREAAAEFLVRRLRSRAMSISEARLLLRGYAADGVSLDSDQVEEVIEDFCRRGYLDDAALADQLITSGVERKGQGRIVLARALAQHGVSREVIDAALGELPDDDAERALDFARTEARSLARLEHDTALRRLVGQLARRGYPSAVAMKAAKAALREVSSGPASGVRFVDSD